MLLPTARPGSATVANFPFSSRFHQGRAPARPSPFYTLLSPRLHLTSIGGIARNRCSSGCVRITPFPISDICKKLLAIHEASLYYGLWPEMGYFRDRKWPNQTNQAPEIEPPEGRYSSRMDDRGRVKLPVAFQRYLEKFEDKRLVCDEPGPSHSGSVPHRLLEANQKVHGELYRRTPRRRRTWPSTLPTWAPRRRWIRRRGCCSARNCAGSWDWKSSPCTCTRFGGHIEVLSAGGL